MYKSLDQRFRRVFGITLYIETISLIQYYNLLIITASIQLSLYLLLLYFRSLTNTFNFLTLLHIVTTISLLGFAKKKQRGDIFWPIIVEFILIMMDFQDIELPRMFWIFQCILQTITIAISLKIGPLANDELRRK